MPSTRAGQIEGTISDLRRDQIIDKTAHGDLIARIGGRVTTGRLRYLQITRDPRGPVAGKGLSPVAEIGGPRDIEGVESMRARIA